MRSGVKHMAKCGDKTQYFCKWYNHTCIDCEFKNNIVDKALKQKEVKEIIQKDYHKIGNYTIVNINGELIITCKNDLSIKLVSNNKIIIKDNSIELFSLE